MDFVEEFRKKKFTAEDAKDAEISQKLIGMK